MRWALRLDTQGGCLPLCAGCAGLLVAGYLGDLAERLGEAGRAARHSG